MHISSHAIAVFWVFGTPSVKSVSEKDFCLSTGIAARQLITCASTLCNSSFPSKCASDVICASSGSLTSHHAAATRQHYYGYAIELLLRCLFVVLSASEMACVPDLLEGLWAGMARAHQFRSLTSPSATRHVSCGTCYAPCDDSWMIQLSCTQPGWPCCRCT